jgi:hypothetical protein
MKLSQIDISALIFAYLLFGAVGFAAFWRVKQPAAAHTFVLVIIAAFLAGWAGISVRLVPVLGFTIYLNWALQALLLGALLSLLTRRMYPVKRRANRGMNVRAEIC